MKLKHTPGPWKAKAGYILGADGYPVANVTYVSKIDGINKKLIIAAPDLLQASIDAVWLLRANKMTSSGAYMMLVVAIEKATGLHIDAILK